MRCSRWISRETFRLPDPVRIPRGKIPLASLRLIYSLTSVKETINNALVSSRTDGATEIENAGNVAVCSDCPTRFLGRDV